ncbi:MAG: TonB family protein [Verrucomicrobiota bacterium]
MNAQRPLLLAAAFAGGLLSPAAVSRASVVVSDLATGSAFRAPVPVKVVSPAGLPRRYQNEVIRLSLTIDEQGRPSNVALLTGRDPALVERLLPAVSQWRFQPAMRDGRPVSTRVVLPIEVVEA